MGISQEYSSWLPLWRQQIQLNPVNIQVPPAACRVTPPLNPDVWQHMLASHPDDLIKFFIEGVTEGFWIGFNYQCTTLKPARKNMHSANLHPTVVTEYLKTDLNQNRVTALFIPSAVTGGHISRFGVIPKHHQSDKWHLIVDLSHHNGYSVNDGIPGTLCSLQYITIDAIKTVSLLGPGTLMAKIDIKSAFHLSPVHPADHHLLQTKWDNLIFNDTCLSFGLHSAPKLFNFLADLLQWITQQHGKITSCTT